MTNFIKGPSIKDVSNKEGGGAKNSMPPDRCNAHHGHGCLKHRKKNCPYLLWTVLYKRVSLKKLFLKTAIIPDQDVLKLSTYLKVS